MPLLISFRVEPAVALLGVLTWRLTEYWLPIPIPGSALAYASLRLSRLRGAGAGVCDHAP